ncbi:MAG: TIGR00730 family Rossman fold protein [Bacteroidetes bacterium]|nr:TIGR00730 family Rossman fold protein [Bacteroidota bacterium]
MKAISVFCGSSRGANPIYEGNALELGQFLAENGIQLIYGGGNVGLMGILADAALKHGGEVIGVIPGFMIPNEVAHKALSQLIIVETMHERKQVMSNISDGVIILPGGFGTLDEFFEMLTWKQLHLHDKPIGILNINNYYDHLLSHFDLMVQEQFLREVNRDLIIASDTIKSLVKRMENHVSPQVEKWINKK